MNNMNIKYLEKFDPSLHSYLHDRLVTRRGDKVKVVDTLTGGRLLGVINIDGHDRVITYDSNGIAIGECSSDLNLYVDTSLTVYVNVKIDEDNNIKFSKVYSSMEDAIKNKLPCHFDTLTIKMKDITKN